VEVFIIFNTYCLQAETNKVKEKRQVPLQRDCQLKQKSWMYSSDFVLSNACAPTKRDKALQSYYSWLQPFLRI